MSEHSENGLVACATGIMLLMCALACAIFIGTSQLVTPDPYTDRGSLFVSAAIFLLLLSPLGGYLVSHGFLFILRESRGRDNTTNG